MDDVTKEAKLQAIQEAQMKYQQALQDDDTYKITVYRYLLKGYGILVD